MKLEACGRQFEVSEVNDVRAPERRLLASTTALFGEVPIHADMFEADGRFDLDLGEFGAFRAGVTPGDAVEVMRWPAGESLRDEFLFGPVLLSALAANSIFALHASAFRLGAGDAPAVAVIAPSGTGKSTLARAARQRGWERLSDDLAPIGIDAAAKPLLMPHFPQLKLPADQQYPRSRPTRVPLAALIVLERNVATATAPLHPKDVMHTVLSSTISSRLFPPPVLQQHLRFASAIAECSARGTLRTLRLTVSTDNDAPARAADHALGVLHAALASIGDLR